MKAGIILVIIIAIGFAVWKFKERKRVKAAEAAKLHKATIKASPRKKTTKKRHEVDDDTKLKHLR